MLNFESYALEPEVLHQMRKTFYLNIWGNNMLEANPVEAELEDINVAIRMERKTYWDLEDQG